MGPPTLVTHRAVPTSRPHYEVIRRYQTSQYLKVFSAEICKIAVNYTLKLFFDV